MRDTTALSAPMGLALDKTSVYWTNASDNAIYRASNTTNTQATKIGVAPDAPGRIVIANNAAYFTTHTRLMKLLLQ